MIKKIKRLFSKQSNTTQTQAQNDGNAHLNAVSNIIIEWLTARDWRFSHIAPDDDDNDRKHLFFLGFATGDFDWRLIIQVEERLQLVTMFGSLEDPIAPEHRLSAMALVAERSANLFFGDVFLDLSTGELRAKVYFDAEFSRLTHRMLDTQMNVLYQLVELNHLIKEQLPKMPTVSDLSTLLNLAKEQRADSMNDGEFDPFFSPTRTAQ